MREGKWISNTKIGGGKMKKHAFVFAIAVLLATMAQADPWTIKMSMPTKRYYIDCGVVDGKVYVIGGFANPIVGTNEEYDPVANSWTILTPMPTPRSQYCTAVVDGKVYVIGGYNGSVSDSVNEEYDPQTNTWATRAPMPTPRRAHRAAVVDGKIYVIGGWGGGYLGLIEVYDPATDSWETSLTSMQTGRSWPGVGAVNGKIYVIGGYNGSDLTVNEEYDPLTDIWTTKAAMPSERHSPAVGVVNDKLYAIGGRHGPVLDVNEMYDPASDTWETKTPMPTARSLHTAGVVSDRIYVIGGWDGGIVNWLGTNEEYSPEPTGITEPGFYAKGLNFSIEVRWTVHMEDNNCLYLITRSIKVEESEFQEIARIHGTGISPSEKTYSYRDEAIQPGMRYFYKLGIVEGNGDTNWYGPVSAIAKGPTGNLRVFPNPVRDEAVIQYSLATRANVSLRVCDISGRVVSMLYSGPKQAGSYSANWKAVDDDGVPLSSGAYFCILKTTKEEFREKILLFE